MQDCVSKRRTIVLSYDDGPSEVSKALLDLLARTDTKATFFAMGGNVDAQPTIAQAIIESGHDLGHHSYQHLHGWRDSPFKVHRDILDGEKAIANAGGDRALFRPTHGKLTLASLLLGLRRGYRFCWWSLDSKDWDTVPMSHEEVLNAIRTRGGAVILLHDGKTYKTANHAQHVVDLTEKIIRFAEAEGFQISRLSDIDIA